MALVRPGNIHPEVRLLSSLLPCYWSNLLVVPDVFVLPPVVTMRSVLPCLIGLCPFVRFEVMHL